MSGVIRSIKAVLSAEVSRFTGPIGQAKSSVDSLASSADKLGTKSDSSISKLSTSLRDNRQSWDQLASSSLKAGATIGLGLGLATKAAISWESAWAGVMKTVDASPEQYAELEESLRGLAKQLPATHEEIAGVAEAAGQLGVAREDIVGFTKTAIDLGESTNLMAEEAATSLAQFSNVMGTAAREGVIGYEKLGAVLVELGNNGASTEKDIVSLAARLSGASVVVGATEADTLALASAMASLGIQSELGGGAMARTLLTINSAVTASGDELTEFARVSGVSAQEFAEKWESDPITALDMFLQGLGRVSDEGGDAAQTLEDLGLAGTMNASVLLRLAGAGDELAKSLALARAEWVEHDALQEEASKRYETTESRLRIAQNAMKDAAIDAGSVLGPALAEAASWAASLADAFAKLPAPIQQGIVGFAALASGGLLLLGTGIKVATTIQDTAEAMRKVGNMGPRAQKGLDMATSAAKRTAAAMTGLVIAGALIDSSLQQVGIQQLTKDFLEAEDAVDAYNNMLREAAVVDDGLDSGVKSLGDALRYSLDPNFLDQGYNAVRSIFGVFGMENTSNIQIAGQRLESLDQTLSNLVSTGNGDRAAAIFKQMAAEAEAQGYSVAELERLLPGYSEALAAAEVQNQQAAEATDTMTAAAEEQARQAQETSDEIRSLAEAIIAQYNAAITASNANIAYEEALIATTEAIKENGKTAIEGGEALDISTAAGIANQKALNALAAQALSTAEANLKNGDSVDTVAAALQQSRDDFVQAAMDMGMNEAAANALADEFGLTAGTADDLSRSINDIPGSKNVNFTATDNASGTIAYIKRGIDGLKDRTVNVRVVTSGTSTLGGLTLASGAVLDKSQFGLVKAFASGGMMDGTIGQAQPQLRSYQGPQGILWSEEGSGPWESFISGHPAKRDRSRAIWLETGKRLGMIAAYAEGALRERSATAVNYGRPVPASGAFGPPLSGAERRAVEVNIPIQTVERADPVAIGAQVVWQLGGLP